MTKAITKQNKQLATFKNYLWRKGARVPKEWAPIFGERVDWLQERLGRSPKVVEVLEDARDENSPIHDMFKWDDKEAAEKFRMFQASSLLSALVIKVEIVNKGKTEEIEMPVRVVLKHGHRSGGEHEHIKDILNDRERRGMMLEMAADELISIRRRFSYLKELTRVFHEVNNVTRNILPLINKKVEKGAGQG